MKRTVALILIAVMALGFAACAQKQDMTVKKDENGNWDITGTWKLIDQRSGSKVTSKDRFTFYPDGTYTTTLTDDMRIPYRISGNIFVEGTNSWGLSVEGDTMTWKLGDSYMTFRRIALLSDEG